MWSRLAHPNILPLLGFVLEGNGYPSLISAWMERGTAFNYVKNNPQEDITPMVQQDTDILCTLKLKLYPGSRYC